MADAEVRKAWAESSSQNGMAALLNCHYSTAAKQAIALGLEVPAPHWGRQEDELSPGEQLRADLETDRYRERATKFERLYQAARAEIREQRILLDEVILACGRPIVTPVLRPPLEQDGHKPARSAIVHLSDWQMGQQVSAVDTGGNVYDWDIMLSRVGRFFEGSVGSIRNIMRAYRIEEIVYLYGGDMLEGHGIFEGQPYQLCKDAGAQTVEGSVVWANFEEGIEREFPGIPKRRIVIPGNHGIPGGRSAGAVPSSISYEHMWYELLRHHTKLLETPSEYAHHGRILFEVAGQPILTTHGDEIRGQLGIPFYGIRTGWMKHTQELGEVFRYWLFGHIHQTSMVTYGDGAALSNGDAVGYNNLTGKLRNPASTPQQSVYFFSRERGLDEISYIHLVEAVL